MNRKKRRDRVLLYIVLSLIAIVQIIPLVIAAGNSLRTDGAIKKIPIGFPFDPQFINYVKAWEVGGYAQAFLNSFTISITSSAVVLVCAILSGYFLARTTLKIKRLIFLYYGVSLSIPVFSYLVPLYYSFANLNLVNTISGIILIYIAVNLPFNILLARTFILGIPQSLDEAATIDGCSSYQIIWRVIFPLSKPIITTIVLIVFVATWNEFTMANTFLQLPELKTAATRYVLFVGERGSDLSLIYTAGVISFLPIVIMFLALQNYFIEGMTSGSIK
jgi:raffinose/stachyose/melibiose transport system permease protein